MLVRLAAKIFVLLPRKLLLIDTCIIYDNFKVFIKLSMLLIKRKISADLNKLIFNIFIIDRIL